MNLAPTRRFRSVLFEFILIVAGVLLALGVDEWREEAQREELTGKVMGNVAAELADSIAAIEIVLPYHESMVEPLKENFRALTEDGQFTFPPPGYRGFAEPELNSAAYESALLTGVLARLDPDTVQALARVDQQREIFRARADRQSAEILRTSFTDGQRYIRLVMIRFDWLLTQERKLLAVMQDAQDLIRAH